MGFSVTPKMHGMESHVVRQMGTIPGGIGKLMEHWIEQYYQTSFRFDQAYCCIGTLVGQAAIQSSAEKRGRNPTSPIKQNVTGKKICWNTKKKRPFNHSSLMFMKMSRMR